MFVFFGLVAVVGTTYVQTRARDRAAWRSATGCRRRCGRGRDRRPRLRDPRRQQPARHPDRRRGRQADPGRRARRRPDAALYVALLVLAALAAVGVALAASPWALLALVALVPGARGVAVVRSGAVGGDLVPVLQLTGVTELLYGLGLFVGLLLA